MEDCIRNSSILIVDDVRATRGILKALLRDMGIGTVHEAEDGTEALRILQARRVDALITDIVMSPMGGLELTRKLRQPYGKNAFVPVMIISGHDDEKHIKDAMDAGVAAFVKKPVVAGIFTARLRSILLHPRAPVRASQYWGPDRRKRDFPVQKDRRSDFEIDLDTISGEDAPRAPL